MLRRIIQATQSFTPRRYFKGSKYVGAGALIFNPSGEILLIKNRLRNAWEYPAGGAEGKESPLETCRREVAEEVGLQLLDYQLVGVDFWYRLTPNGNLLFTFSSVITTAQMSEVTPQAREVSNWRWASRSEALTLIPLKLRPRFEQLLTAYDTGKPVYLQTGSPVV